MDLYKQRLKNDFAFYVKEKLYVPMETDGEGKPIPMIITSVHKDAVFEITDSKKVLVMWYRWFGKSVLVSYAYALWRADMWNESSAIISSNETLASQKLDWIRTEVEFGNPKLAHLSAAWMSSMTWNKTEIWLLDRDNPMSRTGKDGKLEQTFRVKAKIYALGIGGSFRGIHVHNIIADDIVVEENSWTEEMRTALTKKFLGAAWGMKLKGDRTKVILVGTPQHPEDVLMTIKKSTEKGWGKFILPVLTPEGMPSCPEMHDMNWIEEQKEFLTLHNKDNIWRQEYLLEAPDLNNLNFFWEELLENAKDHNAICLFSYNKHPDEMIIIGTDFSVIEDKNHAEKYDSDYFALVCVAFNGVTWERKIINIFRERWLWKWQQLNMVLHWDRIYEANFIAVELHAFLGWAAQDLKNSTTMSRLFDTGDKKGKYNLDTGIPSLQYTFEKWQYKFPYYDDYSKEYTNAVFQELKALNKSSHDDLGDALLRTELVIKAHQGGLVEYDSEFWLYKTMTKTRQKQIHEKRAIDARLGSFLQ